MKIEDWWYSIYFILIYQLKLLGQGYDNISSQNEWQTGVYDLFLLTPDT
jgi:hypothetical protein